jgi:crotonobetainyl-CoA:carnitine CoA-transferase CaiB-like acyl-CoA transferase
MPALKTTAEWFEILGKTNVPVMIVNSIEDLITDEHLVATGFWKAIDHPTEGQPAPPRHPCDLLRNPRRHPPRLGDGVGFAPDLRPTSASAETRNRGHRSARRSGLPSRRSLDPG